MTPFGRHGLVAIDGGAIDDVRCDGAAAQRRGGPGRPKAHFVMFTWAAEDAKLLVKRMNDEILGGGVKLRVVV